jgi:hypothetical protein
MMRVVILAVALVAIGSAMTVALAQPAGQPSGAPSAPAATPPPSAPPASAPSATAPVPQSRPRVMHPPSSRTARPTPAQIRAAREECRQEMNAQRLRGSERATRFRACFAAKMPSVVKRTACRKQAKAKGLAQSSFRSYVRACMSGRT